MSNNTDIQGFPCKNCNECKNINITEEEQEIDKNKCHKCNVYGNRLFHRSTFNGYGPYIYPCNKCVEDKYISFERR